MVVLILFPKGDDGVGWEYGLNEDVAQRGEGELRGVGQTQERDLGHRH